MSVRPAVTVLKAEWGSFAKSFYEVRFLASCIFPAPRTPLQTSETLSNTQALEESGTPRFLALLPQTIPDY